MCGNENLGFAKGGGSSVREIPRKGNKVFRETKVFKNPPFAWKIELFWCTVRHFLCAPERLTPKRRGCFFKTKRSVLHGVRPRPCPFLIPRCRWTPLKKSNNFEPFFSDSALTFLTSENTFRLPILPSRRIIFLCLPLIKTRGRQIKIRGRQIFPGSASKIPDFKGKVTKKGGSRGSSHISVQI